MKKIDTKTVMLGMQLIMLVVLMIFLIISAFNSEFLKICEIICGIILFVIAYNNKTIYKRKSMTKIYLIGGIFMTFMGIWNIING